MERVYYFIRSEVLGTGDDELGKLLMCNFLYTVAHRDTPPAGLIFINSGVKLPTVVEEVHESLALLEEKGVEMLSCGTCLDYYGLKDKLVYGKVSNIHEIVDRLAGKKVVTV
ncbi:MAG: sulfurtransferase-like selenium metabolism protein YedF [Firmicutes bacterium]|nr:sulfurtransferase-like selenium metabolism protein YedF [Bacillota bacterium]